MTSDNSVEICRERNYVSIRRRFPPERSGRWNDGAKFDRVCFLSSAEKVHGLDFQNVVNIACGEYHSMAVNEWGQVFSWGSNSHGQLGIIESDIGIGEAEI